MCSTSSTFITHTHHQKEENETKGEPRKGTRQYGNQARRSRDAYYDRYAGRVVALFGQPLYCLP